ncbi:MAG: imidazole glycerol phosphate synthase subunit HisH [Thermoanaerobaculum sp.]|nr:imidazole glycerol phosphate synthase subunit HisH [Thermoanaerobaculum sp.]
MTVTVVDLQVGNIPNVVRAFTRLGCQVRVTAQPEEVRASRVLVLPGVGAAPAAVASLARDGLAGAVQEAVGAGAWLLGICLGHQLLFEELWEFGRHRGLGLLAGVVAPLPEGVRSPHMGWARIHALRADFASLHGRWFYFVHSFVALPQVTDLVAVAHHDGHEICAVVRRQRVIGVQFHPEKSGPEGEAFLREFCEMVA